MWAQVAIFATCSAIQGGGRMWIPKGWRGGVRPKAKKKIVTFLISMAEAVVNVSEGTLDASGSARVQGVVLQVDLPY
jgi:hypothetical protein